jgi:hypothetical protein
MAPLFVTMLLCAAPPALGAAGAASAPPPAATTTTPDTAAPGEKPRDAVSRAVDAGVGTAVAGVAGLGALVGITSWGVVAGGGLGALFALGGTSRPPGGSAALFNVALFAGLGALLGGLMALPMALLARVGTDTLVWLFVTAGKAPPLVNARADIPILVVSSIAVFFMALAAGVALAVRAPQGGLTRDPLGTVAWTLAAAGLAVLPSIPLLTGAIILRAVFWWKMTG